jgi:hypothetical protein
MTTMSPEMQNRWKLVGQSICGIIVLFAAFRLCGPGILGEGGQGDTSRVLSFFAAARDDESLREYSEAESDCEEEDEELEYAHVWSMPTYVDLRVSIERLQETRDDLQKARDEGEAEAILAANQEYRAAVQEVRDGFATLKKRVAPDDFADASQEFLGLCATGKGQSVTPRELGHLQADIWQ